MKIALVGNPNCGKTSLFNQLTNSNQKIGNFIGVTVDVCQRNCVFDHQIDFIDLPGTYTLHPKSKDEKVVFDILLDKSHDFHPDIIIAVLDSSNLKRNLLLFSQLSDLNIPIIIALTMIDDATSNNIEINYENLSYELQVPVLVVDPRSKLSVKDFFQSLKKEIPKLSTTNTPFYLASNYQKLDLHKFDNENIFINFLKQSNLESPNAEIKKLDHNHIVQDTLNRYKSIEHIYKKCVYKHEIKESNSSIDKFLLDPFIGVFIFILTLFIIFQLIFYVSEYPVTWIEDLMLFLSNAVSNQLSDGLLKSFLVEGFLSGITGVLVFVPQIILLFSSIAFLEQSGYITRAMFMSDQLMRKVGLNGKSLIPLLSGTACAIPAIMATRSISNFKERLITILIIPLMACSARLPVYTIMISLLLPSGSSFKKSLILMLLYFMGLILAIICSTILNLIIKSKQSTFLAFEIPPLRLPVFNDMYKYIKAKTIDFIYGAGKMIVAFSLLVWILSSFKFSSNSIEKTTIEHSVLADIGHFIEPAIKPLGYDWKIGIALLSSFAAREVFVGTLSTIYSIQNSENDANITSVLSSIKLEDGTLLFSTATVVSILVFFMIAMQCSTTVIIVKKETNSWLIALSQMIFLTSLAYLLSFISYSILS